MLDGRIALVAHDAGGAEILSSFVRRQKSDCLFYLEGPAKAIFARKLNVASADSLEHIIAQSDWLLCGTSWQSDLECRAIQAANTLGKPSVAWLDHWVNYRSRFEHGKQPCFPDEIWVSDEIALQIAKQQIPEIPARLEENPYLNDIKQELINEPAAYPRLAEGQRVLYVCEPIKEHALLRFGDARHWGYTEDEALMFFLDNLQVLGSQVRHIVIRRHPSEKSNKYEDIVARYDLPLEFSSGGSLGSEIVSSDCVVGCNSMAMVIGLLASKRVISCIPPGGAACSLPQPDIEHLQQLLCIP